MNQDTYLILAILISGLYLIYFLLSKKLDRSEQDNAITTWLKSVQESLTSSNQHLTSTLQRSYSDLHQRLDKASQVMGDLKREAGTFSEIGRSMQELQDFLKSPKLRGNIGEQVLKDLISQMFPKSSFHLQYSFKSGHTVDAAIKTDAGILPIDSKFPLENFQKMVKSQTKPARSSFQKAFIRDVRKHIRDIAGKYILPNEGTMDFALMYIPSEPVYYEAVSLPEVIDYARSQRVYPVSPTTLYAHLQTILLSFEGKKIESHSKEVFALMRGIQKDYQKLEDNLTVLNKHLTNAHNQLNNTSQVASQIGSKLHSGRSLTAGKE